MADTKGSALTALTGAASATGDLVVVIDVSDTTQGASGTTKNMTRAELVAMLKVADARIGAFLSADESKLDGIATSATANDTDANLLARANHTGTQIASTISDANTIGAGDHSIYVPAGAMVSRTTSGAAAGSVETSTNKVMIDTLDFDTAADEFAQFSFRAPKSWNESTVTAFFVWSHPVTTTNFGVSWGLQGVALSNDDAADAAFGTAIVTDDTGGTTDDIYQSAESAAVTIAGTPAENDWVVMQVFRDVSDANDDMAVDARLHGVLLLLTTNANTDA